MIIKICKFFGGLLVTHGGFENFSHYTTELQSKQKRD